MVWLRLLLLVGCLGAIALSTATTPWEARLVRDNHSWIMNLGRHPVWQPPAAPGYAAFRQHFERAEEFPLPDGGWTIRVGYDPAEVGLAAMAYCWPVALICGLLYLAIRGSRRDLVLHCALRVAAGLSAAVVACIALWCMIGGWGPPAVGWFGILGVVGGILNGLASYRNNTPDQLLQPTPPHDGFS
jgi:hypothetical protein